MGDYPKAIEYQDASLTIARQSHDRNGEETSLNATLLLAPRWQNKSIAAIQKIAQARDIAAIRRIAKTQNATLVEYTLVYEDR
jgi:hypothetical protein